MMLIKRLNMRNWLKRSTLLRLLILAIYLKKLTITKKLAKLNQKYLIIIMIKILPFKILQVKFQKTLLKDEHKQN